MSSAAAVVPAAARSIIYLGMDVHKDSITIAVLPGGGEDADAPRAAAQRSPEAEEVARARGARRRGPRVLRGERRRVRAASRAARVGLRVRRDRAVADPEAVRRAAQARQARRRRSGAALSRRRARRGAHPERGGGAGARCRALPRDLPARDPQVAALHPEVPGDAAGSCFARAPTGARRTCSGCST